MLLCFRDERLEAEAPRESEAFLVNVGGDIGGGVNYGGGVDVGCRCCCDKAALDLYKNRRSSSPAASGCPRPRPRCCYC